jgi:hypothetical protein
MDNLFFVKGGRRGIKVAIYSNRCLCCGERGGPQHSVLKKTAFSPSSFLSRQVQHLSITMGSGDSVQPVLYCKYAYSMYCIQGGAINRRLKCFFLCIGLHILLKLRVALKSTGWCVVGCWLTIYSI